MLTKINVKVRVHLTRHFYIHLCKQYWDPKDVRTLLTLTGL